MQGINAGIVIVAQSEEFAVYRHEQIYAIFLIWKLFPNMMCVVNQCSIGPFYGCGFGIFGIDCMAEVILVKVPYGNVQVRNLCAL